MADLTGFFGLHAENARSFLAGLAEFQTWAGVGSEALAKGRIWRFAVHEAGWVRPCVLLDFAEGFKRPRTSSDGFELGSGGKLMVLFEKAAGGSVDSDPEQDLIAFMNGVEVVTAALALAASGQEASGGVALDVRDFYPVESPSLEGEAKGRGRPGERPERFYRWLWMLEFGG